MDYSFKTKILDDKQLLHFLGFDTTKVRFLFEDQENRHVVTKTTTRMYQFMSDEPVKGSVHITLPKDCPLEHQGIILELIGRVEVNRGSPHDFLSQTQKISPSGVLKILHSTFEFNFSSETEKSYESYYGTNAKLRYFLRLTINRGFLNIVHEEDIWIINFQKPPSFNSSIKMEVGVEECVHIEFEYGRSKYHLQDVILGKVYFLFVRVKVKYMEIALVRKETTGSGPNVRDETCTLIKYEIMDGTPAKGESIPVRLFLGALDLTPTFKNVCNKFSVKYMLNLVMVDDEERRYFRQREITLWRMHDTPKDHSWHKLTYPNHSFDNDAC